MGFLDRFRKRKPTPRQLELLSRITNPKQKEALLTAIEQGEDIPEYAWTPVSEELLERVLRDPTLQQLIEEGDLEEASEAESPDDDVRRYAIKARETANEASGHLCTPFGDCDTVGGASNFTPLCAWGIFNPFGPTMTSLMLVPVPDSDERLLFFRTLNPFLSSAVVYGLLPDASSRHVERLVSILGRLFERNGSADYPILQSLPTHVRSVAESPLSSHHVKELLFLAAQRVTNEEDIDAKCDGMLRYKGDPWGRASAELKDGLRAANTTLTRERKPTPPTRSQLERWWGLVTDLQHVEAEGSQMEAAWEGANQFSQRKDR